MYDPFIYAHPLRVLPVAAYHTLDLREVMRHLHPTFFVENFVTTHESFGHEVAGYEEGDVALVASHVISYLLHVGIPGERLDWLAPESTRDPQ